MASALAALDRGEGASAVRLLNETLRRASLSRDEELAVRCALAEAWLLQGELTRAASALGRPPDSLREAISPVRASALWRLHGRIAFARGDQSRAIALHGRALKQAEVAHDSQAIGLAHYELGLCYKQVGDLAIVREHIAKAASALHAAGDRRHLALVHSQSGITLAQAGRSDEAMAALRQAERLASSVEASDVLATVCGNQAVVTMMQHRYDQALELAERSVALHERPDAGPGLAVSLATLGQICVKQGDLARAEGALHQALQVRSAIQFHETTGAVFDTLAQIHIIRGEYEKAAEYLDQAGDAYGAYGAHTSRWYEWSVKVLRARLALRRGRTAQAVELAGEIEGAEAAPPADALQASLIAIEALTESGRFEEAEARLSGVSDRLDPRAAPAAWGQYLRLRGALQVETARTNDAYHDLAQSASVFELLGERYESALTHLALGRLVATSGARSTARRHLTRAREVFSALGASRDLQALEEAETLLGETGTGEYLGFSADADDAIIRRIVDAAALPDLLGQETAAALLEAAGAEWVAVFVHQESPESYRLLGRAGCDEPTAVRLARAAVRGGSLESGRIHLSLEPLGRGRSGRRVAVIAATHAFGYPVARRLRMIATVARQGFDLCAAREPAPAAPDETAQHPLEPLLPGFLCASATMARVVEQIRRLQGNDLTVLITGESGTGKELVARAVHVGSHRRDGLFLPYNCTTTGRDLADSQLFGHRRGAFTGAVTDQPGLVRTAAGGTLFLDEIGDLPLDVQPKLLRVLDQQEVMPVGETRPQRVDVRVLAATNADLEQKVAEGTFREDLYYRLSVIRIHVPPLRERREEIPHLATYFLREACARLDKPDVQFSPEALDAIVQYWWPGNVRQLRNEIQRAVAMSAPEDVIGPAQLSPELSGLQIASINSLDGAKGLPVSAAGDLATAVSQVEREVIRAALTRCGGNISRSARTLGLTRRGLYLKMRRLGIQARLAAD
ncbi:MAG: sigma 54-interacting transcriptional regulator [Acidobacteriota bacterium]|nr:sigma 54-interacting transcriptional regulator [Acidobacteriota bacterium]